MSSNSTARIQASAELATTRKRSRGPSDGDADLREDIRLLGRLLGDTIREQAGSEVFDLVESIRRTAIRYRIDGSRLVRRVISLGAGRTTSLKPVVRGSRDGLRELIRERLDARAGDLRVITCLRGRSAHYRPGRRGGHRRRGG